MDPGKLDKRITIERASEAPDTAGQVIQTWSVFSKAWASYKAGSGAESFTSDQRSSKSSAVFRIRYQAGVNPKMRVLFDGEYWEIEAVHPVGRRDHLDLVCHSFEVQSGP